MPSRIDRLPRLFAGAAALALILATASCRGAPAAAAADAPFTATVRFGATSGAVNRRLLGSNVQWVDRGDELLNADGSRFDPQMLELVSALGPTVLRYPGGSLADTFNWEAGSGPMRSRGTSERFHSRDRETVLFGTAEYLALCRRLGAEPIITVNVATGSARGAANWVRSLNQPVDSSVAGPVRFWEVGNEPYLREAARPEIAVGPAVFAGRANAFIRAMREADPAIAIGLPMRRDRLGVLPAVAFPGYAQTVLEAVNEPFDFISVHNAYLPFVLEKGGRYRPEEVFRASMAAYRVVEEDLRLTRQLVERRHPGATLPFAVTEYNAIYTLGGDLDGDVASLGAALYVADLLRTLAGRDDILMANFWSLTGNGTFGAVSNRRRIQPAYEVLRAFAAILRGERVQLEIAAPTFDAPAVGAVPATSGVPLIAAMATSEPGRRRLLLINKSDREAAVVTVQIGVSERPRAWVVRELGDARIFDPSHATGVLRWRDVPAEIKGGSLQVTVGAHALLWADIDVQ